MRKNRYRVVVDYWTDTPKRDEIKPVREYKTLAEAKNGLVEINRTKHFACKYSYYIQEYKGTKWVYVGKGPKLTYDFHSIKLTDGRIIKLPIIVTLTRSEAAKGDPFAVIEKLIKKWPKEAK